MESSSNIISCFPEIKRAKKTTVPTEAVTESILFLGEYQLVSCALTRLASCATYFQLITQNGEVTNSSVSAVGISVFSCNVSIILLRVNLHGLLLVFFVEKPPQVRSISIFPHCTKFMPHN